jgi:2-hydroxy-3-keto-5-methylthiopentenyl-1-phosphate phosphatase
VTLDAAVSRAVFVDFDGTITDLDTFDVLVRHFAGDDAWHETERGLRDGSLSLRDVLQLQASYVRGSFDEIAALLEREVRVDPTFASFVEACESNGASVTVVSSGIAPIVRGRLAALGLERVPVVANDVDARPDGWTIRFRDDVDNGTDKAAIVRTARADGMETIFIGDGRSDFDAAVAADRCFAKRGRALERYLRERAAGYEPFDAFAQIEAALTIPLARSFPEGT